MAEKINVPEIKTQEQLLTAVQEYFELRARITGCAEEVLANEKDPQVVHTKLIRPSEELAARGVEIRRFIGDCTKECHGPKGSIADRAVEARRKLFETKETKVTEGAEPAKK